MPSALGSKFAEKDIRVVQADEDMETLKEVGKIEVEAARTLVHFFFPGRCRPKGPLRTESPKKQRGISGGNGRRRRSGGEKRETTSSESV